METKQTISHCPSVLRYTNKHEMAMIRNKVVLPPEQLNEARKRFLVDVKAVKIFEAQPKLPYEYPYTFGNKDSVVTCDKYPILPEGVSLYMLKTQMNEVSQFLGLGIQFPEVLEPASDRGTKIKINSQCPSGLMYAREAEMINIRKNGIPQEAIEGLRERFLISIEVIKVFEAQPKLPYKFPYTFDNPDSVMCDKLPILPKGVTLLMIKKQMNEISQLIGLGIQFPEVLPSNTPIVALPTGEVGVVLQESSKVVEVPKNVVLPVDTPSVALPNGGVGVVVQTPPTVVPIAQTPVISKDAIEKSQLISNKLATDASPDYTIYYILLVVLVAFAIIYQIYTNSNVSSMSIQQTSRNNGISGYY